MADADVLDLDAVRAARIEEHPIEYRELKLYGRIWHIRTNPNIATLLVFADGGGTKGQMEFLLGYVQADERDAFREAITADEYFDEEMLGAVTDFFTGNTVGKDSEKSSTSEPSSSPITPNLTDASLSEAPPVSTPSPSEAPSTTPTPSL